MTRDYRLNERARRQAETRRKIVEAAIELHQAKGVAATSMRDIAERAGVGTVTVYRHFADDTALLEACSGTYLERHPLPDPEAWRGIPAPRERLREGLRQTYAYHRATEPMMASVLAEVSGLPAAAPYEAAWRRAAEVLLEAWPGPARCDMMLRAALALALRFETWQVLTGREGLSDAQAADLMVRLTCDCDDAAPR